MDANHPVQTAMNPRHADSVEAAIIREMVRHEDELVNERINWLVSSQTILFGALAFVWNSPGVDWLLYILVFVGLGVSASTFFGLRDSAQAIRKVRGWWDDHKSHDYYGPDVVGLRGRNARFRLFKPWNVIPTVFIIAWCCVPIASHFKGKPAQAQKATSAAVTPAGAPLGRQP